MVDVVITHSATEAALLRAQLPGILVSVVPWSVALRPSSTSFGDRHGVAFIGNFRHEPNIDAVHWLAEGLLPLVRQADPSIEFEIIGSHMPSSVKLLAQPGLKIVGHVDHLEAVFDRVRLTIAPLRYGAGLKGKVIESLAAGIPCIGTSIAYEGMSLTPPLIDCVANTSEAVNAALLRHYRDESAHHRCRDAALQYAARNHNEVDIDLSLQEVVRTVLRHWPDRGRLTHTTMRNEATQPPVVLERASGDDGDHQPLVRVQTSFAPRRPRRARLRRNCRQRR
jgi:glycosyltransferase involved in cell wall biosynthesis